MTSGFLAKTSLGARALTLTLGSLLLTHCVSYEPRVLVPALTLTAEDISLANPASTDRQIDFGLDVAVNESDSLLNVAVLPGVRVRSVSPGGAADAAGIRPGDVILAVNDVATNHPDALLALTQQAPATDSLQFTMRRNTVVFETAVTARVLRTAQAPQELYRADPLATRAGYRTEMIEIRNRAPVLAARVMQLFPGSPLPEAGINIGDIVLAVDGRELNSAQDLITRVNQDYELGSTVAFTIYADNELSSKSVSLWDPGRRISRISLGPLFNYTSSLNPSSDSITFLNLWLFAVYQYHRVDGEKSHSLLGLFNFTSNYGELVEEAN